MARPPRVLLAGGVYHVIQRGNYRQRIFVNDRDRERFLESLEKYAKPLRYRVHAYCLMDNHVHLLLETLRANLSSVLQRVMGSYTLYFNRKREKVGHLFQGRSKAFLVDGACHLLDVSRYIHLNPVRAGLAGKPQEYRWSSLGRYAPGAGGKSWLTTEAVLAKVEGSRERYLAFVHAGMNQAWKPAPIRQVFLGSEAFARRMMVKLGWDEHTGQRKRPTAVRPPAEIAPDRLLRAVAAAHGLRPRDLRRVRTQDARLAQARAAAMYLLRRNTPLTLREIGALLGGVTPGRVWQAEAAVATSPIRTRRAETIARTLGAP